MYKLFLIALSFMALSARGLAALTIEEARLAIVEGRPSEVVAALDSIAAAQPKNAEIDNMRGECYLAMHDREKAKECFESAQRKGDHGAILSLAEIAVDEYRLDDAEDLISGYKAYIVKNKKKKLTDESGELQSKISRTRAMLDRVEKIVVVDSLIVDKRAFFKAYRLSPESGTLNPAGILPDNLEDAPQGVVYRTEDGREMIWAAPDEDGKLVLKATNLLSDGSWEEAESIGDHLGGDGDVNYPFLMPDGVTLYFASDNSDSLGGYDIFMSRNNGTEYLQPQNIGMPYNSPYDDYMLAIDEMTGIGWWATDRNQIDGKVTIYMFIPEEMRKNVDIEDPDLAARALVSSIRSTWDGEDYTGYLRKAIGRQPKGTSDEEVTFEFAFPDGRVVTSMNGFKNPQTRTTMQRYLQRARALEESEERLDGLRAAYANGNKSVASEILKLEEKLNSDRKDLNRIAGDVVRTEMK